MSLSQVRAPANLPERKATAQEVEDLLLEEYLRRKQAKGASSSFIDFVQEVAPWVCIEETHLAMSEKLDEVVAGTIDRLMMFIAPRTGKSLFTSTLFPAYYIGKYPDRQIMQASHSTNLAESFGRDARNLLLDDDYRRVFPNTALSKDSRSTSSWATTEGGKYNAVGVGAGIAGKGFHLGVCLRPNTPIHTKRGVLPADEVVVGDDVFGETGFGKVTGVSRRVATSYVVVNEQLHCTPEHPVFVEKIGYVPSASIRVGDKILTPRLTTLYYYNIVASTVRFKEALWGRLRELGKRLTTCGR